MVGLAVLLLLALVAAAYWFTQQQQRQPGPTTAPSPAAVSDLWEVAFTSPLIPDDRSRHRGGIDERLAALMDRASRTLDVAIYELDLPSVASAMARAAQRGVRVRMVTDTDTVEDTRNEETQAALKTVRDAGIAIVADNRQPIMHHKFTVVDNTWVQTGSWNYTIGDTYRLNNNQAIFRSPELAQNYTAEFEKMFNQKQFGPNKARGVPNPTVSVGDLRIETYFSSQDKPSGRIIERINQAQRTIRFLAFSFTHNEIGDAMIARARAGVDVQGVFETTGSNTQFSEMGRMRGANLPNLVVVQDGNPYVMHHKVIVVDERVTIFGSYNFSDNAENGNDENLLIVEGAAFAAQFEQEFQRVQAMARNPASTKPAAKK